jgi:hypothetical protein
MPTTRRAESLSSAVDELKELIEERHPDASFRITKGDDPPGVYLAVAGTGDDFDGVMDAFIERLAWFQDEQHLRLYVVFQSQAEHDLFQPGASVG